MDFTLQNCWKTSTFSALFENADFAKIIDFTKQNHYISGLELPEFAPKSRLKRVRKKDSEKIEFRVDFW